MIILAPNVYAREKRQFRANTETCYIVNAEMQYINADITSTAERRHNCV